MGTCAYDCPGEMHIVIEGDDGEEGLDIEPKGFWCLTGVAGVAGTMLMEGYNCCCNALFDGGVNGCS